MSRRVRQATPFEYTAAAGGAAYIIGNDNPIATLNHTCSFTTDTPDFWRPRRAGVTPGTAAGSRATRATSSTSKAQATCS